MKVYRYYLGTQCSIDIKDNNASSKDIQDCFMMLERFEKNYSRFISGNILSSINTEKKHTLTKELQILISLGIKLGDMTQGCFDITLLPYLENAGYGIQTKKIKEDTGYKNIHITDSEVILKNGINIEFGAYGKGYMLDMIYSFLAKKYENFILDFGGDIKAKGEKDIYLEDPQQTDKYFGKIRLKNSSIASSNGFKRQFKSSHHLINSKNGKSHNHIYTVFCCHKNGILADAFATVFSVTPKHICKKIMQQTSGLEVYVIYHDRSELRSGKFIHL